MMISSKGRYALRVMLDLAEHGDGSYLPLRDIAQRQEISQKYLESIMAVLSKNALVDGQHGKGGGYRLNRPPQDYRVGDILHLTEGTLAPVACLESCAGPCDRAEKCRTRPMWSKLERMITDYLDSVSLAELAEGEI